MGPTGMPLTVKTYIPGVGFVESLSQACPTGIWQTITNHITGVDFVESLP